MRGRKAAPCPRQPPAGAPGLEKLFPGTVGVPQGEKSLPAALGERRQGICAGGAGMPSLRMLRCAGMCRALLRLGTQPWPGHTPNSRSERFPEL